MYTLQQFASLDSTNAYALRELAKLEHATVIVADTQTAGRGRLGRVWVSPPGQNLYFSIVLKDFPQQYNHNLLSVIAALAVVQVLRDQRVPAEIKWPNDVLVAQKKICGILTEATKTGIVLGIGLNVNMSAAELGLIDQPVTSLAIELGQMLDRDMILKNILHAFFELYAVICREGFAPVIALWQHELKILGRRVRVVMGQRELIGSVMRLDPEGGLLIEHATGQERIISGDVHYMD